MILQGRKFVAFRALPLGLEVALIFKGTEASGEGTKTTFHPSPPFIQALGFKNRNNTAKLTIQYSTIYFYFHMLLYRKCALPGCYIY